MYSATAKPGSNILIKGTVMPDPPIVPSKIDFNLANGKQLQLIRTALLGVFLQRSKLVRFLSDEFGKNFDAIAQGDSFESAVFYLLRDAHAEGWLADLVNKAIDDYPRAPALKNIIDQWFLLADADVQTSPSAADQGAPGSTVFRRPAEINLLEEIVNRLGAVAAQRWLNHLTSIRRRVCRITRENEEGHKTLLTGFLVGPDLVLTVGRLGVAGPAKYDTAATAQFDFEVNEGRIQEGHKCLVRCTEVFLDGHWRPSTTEELLKEDAPVWFGLLQLQEPEGSRVDGDSPARGWFDLSVADVNFVAGEPLFLFHFPKGEHLQMSQGSLRGATTPTRFLYEGMTAPGSSGAPVFNRDFRLLGLHEGSLGTQLPAADGGKIGLRADAIARVLSAKGRLRSRWAEPEAEPAA
jgi:hypothetical protein